MINFRIYAWSAYLCCSWMWCIGLFYPVLLYRDFGSISWYFFSIPNILGAVFFPWVIKNAQQSKDFIKKHIFFCKLFSFVTVLFQFYFLLCILIPFVSIQGLILILFFSLLFFFICENHILIVSPIIWTVSLLSLLVIFKFHYKLTLPIPVRDNVQIKEVLGLLPVFIIGFFFCPYLDLTFHRVVKELQIYQLKLAYIIAFLLLFLCFLILGIYYYPIAYQVFFRISNPSLSPAYLAFYIYIIIQIVFTGVVHLQEFSNLRPSVSFWNFFIYISIGLFLYAVFANGEIIILGKIMYLREIIYRCFLSFYGLATPLYFWIFCINTYSCQSLTNRKKWFIWLIIFFAVLPFYILGFFGDFRIIPYVLPAGVLIILLAPYLISHLIQFTCKK